MKDKISAVILTKNEEKNIKNCLKYLRFCDEIILIDDFSKDKTTKFAKKFRAKIFKRELKNNFALQRNFGLIKAKNPWVLFVDADEVVSSDLKKEIIDKIKKPDIQGYFLVRKDYIFGKEMKHGEFSTYGWFGNAKLLRLARKNAGKWKRNVHEFWEIKGETNSLKNPILHYSHPDLKSFIDNIDSFSYFHSKALEKEGKQVSLLKIIIWPVGKFAYNYIFRLGFLDGLEGFIVAIIMSFHSFLAWTRLWIHSKENYN
ncbi:glycosyltransferase family 2 protein [Candidatus Woesebacteria bacterium]|nr:glycosyltransferase family 2 protein [Candidatus Woesebacteria bacterium]QQG47151.1 MAG: glycosyltransferase family 2 protein [Candidatus Woesebacteria bacterium]